MWALTHFTINLLKTKGFEIGRTETPIIPIYIRDNMKTFQFTKILDDEGVFVNPVVSPGVKSEDSLIRFSLMATHTESQIEFAVEKLLYASKKLNIPLNPIL